MVHLLEQQNASKGARTGMFDKSRQQKSRYTQVQMTLQQQSADVQRLQE